MASNNLTPELIIGTILRIPEAYLSLESFAHRYGLNKKARNAIKDLVNKKQLGQHKQLLYDPARITPAALDDLPSWHRPDLPKIQSDSQKFSLPTIAAQATQRQQLLTPEEQAIVTLLQPAGYMEKTSLLALADIQDETTLEALLNQGFLRQTGSVIYDPLILSDSSIRQLLRNRALEPQLQQIIAFLHAQKGHTLSRAALSEQFGASLISELIANRALIAFSVTHRIKPAMIEWVTFKGADQQKAQRVATTASKIQDSEWQPLLAHCGDLLRPDAKDGKTYRAQVLARSYVLSKAAKRLKVREETLTKAVKTQSIPSFKDLTRSVRLSAELVEKAYTDPDFGLSLTGQEILTVREIALVSGLTYAQARYRLIKENMSTTRPLWHQVCGKWGLPDQLHQFRTILVERKAQWRAERHAAYLAEQQRIAEEFQAAAERERQRRDELRVLLLPVFPDWARESREDQRLFLHVGPPNSGKTHAALDRLAACESGWYLAPLRLLAFEIFDRLNARGVKCSLLTGEEYIPIDGAQITASTIEMFEPRHSGACVVIDEAHMLADPDRGWAWTRALMEAHAPEIHVLASPMAENLVRRLAKVVSLPFEVIQHQRLSPIRVAEQPFRVENLPPRTILVAFSRYMVLELKTQLESQRRSVSVIYGNLPPEVRRRQAERFARGEAEICVATDAVGMGLNLPADAVCFYQLTKFDGHTQRPLLSNEIQQIGGRAGRYQLSDGGVVGAVTREDHATVRRVFDQTPPILTHARVQPSVEALELLSGTLAERLKYWTSLGSIPEHLRNMLKTADLSERIALAQRLTPDEVEQLGLAGALKLVNAPTRDSTRPYWRRCATAILKGRPMPLPPLPPSTIEDQIHLEDTETSVLCADIYLWLSRRQEFFSAGSEVDTVGLQRTEWSLRIDAALLSKIQHARRCSRCGKRLPKHHPYGICDVCYFSRSFSFGSYDDDDLTDFDEFDSLDEFEG